MIINYGIMHNAFQERKKDSVGDSLCVVCTTFSTNMIIWSKILLTQDGALN